MGSLEARLVTIQCEMMRLIIGVVGGKRNIIRRVRATVHFNYGPLVFLVSTPHSLFVKVLEGPGTWQGNYITLVARDCRG
jgi:hypothetical protein